MQQLIKLALIKISNKITYSKQIYCKTKQSFFLIYLFFKILVFIFLIN